MLLDEAGSQRLQRAIVNHVRCTRCFENCVIGEGLSTMTTMREGLGLDPDWMWRGRAGTESIAHPGNQESGGKYAPV